ncbi:HAD-IC family P-type ATPase [Cellulomonas sp. P24]|uniref:HAD-IC family P-type ATPase n=1 Tax=Cellulomonas sp. P24 TaxID=2885206 RepID=UPI00216B48A9|nr:HAD-IC family P-type ATPase [Cellulomonas sp. P24]MCR6494265.1 HAD-IC family P-type ATPase [Cellulomonas sp. P24]
MADSETTRSGPPLADVVGLTADEVAARVADGRVNDVTSTSSRSVGAILRGNVFTLFNGILGAALVVVLVVGQWQDALFGGVLVFNAAIGVIGEYRAKLVLDRLSILNAPDARVVRDGTETSIDVREIVVDDLLLIGAGDQVPVDATVLRPSGLEVDESLLTGESAAVVKSAGDDVLSGSIVVAGSATTRVHHVGADSYANRLTSSVRRFSLVRSELRTGINRVLVVVAWMIGPLSALLMWSQIRAHGGWQAALADGSWRSAAVSGVAGVVGMVPEGLVLLTSINFALAAVVLARRQVLVQELPAVEVLARVDVLCLDKTGTLTDGTMALDRFEDVAVVPGAREALAAMAADPEANVTAAAISTGLVGVVPAPVDGAVAFSSARKWSAVRTATGTWVLGAPSIVLAAGSAGSASVLERAGAIAQDGARVLVLCRAESLPMADEPALPADLVPVVLVVLREHLRPDAATTLAYFRDQGVELTVISGDDPATVAAIATALDLRGTGAEVVGVDATTLPTDIAELSAVMATEHVFGRVTPEQKRAMVHALQHAGRTVAMTGDGVNDALALKDADLGIAMGSGAAATKAVARLVLLDGRFSSLPGVVGEGRRVIANMERVANLFLSKTTYAALLVVASVLLVVPYPFQPRHLTLVSALTIGIPAFFLALAPNAQRYLPGFLPRVLRLAVPSGVLMGGVVFTVHLVLRSRVAEQEARSAATAVLLCCGLWLIGVLARPWRWWKVSLVAVMAAAGVGAFLLPVARGFFALHVLTAGSGVAVLVAGAVGCAGIELVGRWHGRGRSMLRPA